MIIVVVVVNNDNKNNKTQLTLHSVVYILMHDKYCIVNKLQFAVPFSALQLFYTVRNIFQLFYDVVPTYHK